MVGTILRFFCQRAKDGFYIIIFFCGYLSKFDIAVKRLGSTHGHHLNILGSTEIPDASHEVSWPR